MSTSLQVLILEDNPSDAELFLRELRRAGFDPEWQRVETEEEYLAALHPALDIILSDYKLPQFDGLSALRLLRARGLDLPFILVSGTIGEDIAVSAIKEGADDYLLKDRLTRLGPAVRNALEQKRLRDERKQAEAALAAKNEELRAMTQQLWQTAKLATMGELAASIAHELNNPLATVSLRVEGLLSQIAEDDPAHRSLKVIEQESARMGVLVANLLQFSRRGAQQISTLDVREEIAKTLELIHYQLRQRQIVVAQEFAPDVPLIQADRQQLRQLLLNLFTNASDAMPQGGTLTLRVRGEWRVTSDEPAPPDASPATRHPSHVVIEVADTGVGIAPDDLPKVGEPFFTTKPEGKGTGLGLAICRRIAQEHNGTLDLTSAGTGQGATVRVVLPAKSNSNGTFLKEA